MFVVPTVSGSWFTTATKSAASVSARLQFPLATADSTPLNALVSSFASAGSIVWSLLLLDPHAEMAMAAAATASAPANRFCPGIAASLVSAFLRLPTPCSASLTHIEPPCQVLWEVGRLDRFGRPIDLVFHSVVGHFRCLGVQLEPGAAGDRRRAAGRHCPG